jgi:hypothetical protein
MKEHAQKLETTCRNLQDLEAHDNFKQACAKLCNDEQQCLLDSREDSEVS